MGVPKKWQVVSSKPYRWGRRLMMKPGQVFTATEEEIPADFKPMIIALEDTPTISKVVKPVPVEELRIPEKPVTYRIKQRENYFDILDSKGKKVNEQKLSEEEAADLLKKLQA